jgi:hypothetical protein
MFFSGGSGGNYSDNFTKGITRTIGTNWKEQQ